MRRLARLPALLTAISLALAGCVNVPPASQNFQVFFEPGSTRLDGNSQAVIATAAQWARGRPAQSITVIGFAPAADTRPANATLAQSRADAVAAQLVRDGVPPARIARGGRPATDITLEEIEARRVMIAMAGPFGDGSAQGVWPW